MNATEATLLLAGIVALMALVVAGGYYLSKRTTFSMTPHPTSAAAAEQMPKEVEVGLTSAVALEQIVEYMTRLNYNIESRSHDAVTFVRTQGPSGCITLLLLVLFIVPAILYALFGSTTLRVTATAHLLDGGRSRVILGGDDYVVIGELRQWLGGLTPDSTKTEKSVQVAPNAAEQIRQLARLRDDGLISEEEFEAKKKDLLDRM